ncbi:cytochrome P450 83B1-like isoform X2 [Pistacia vera]|uniref:cytochrome P450 83B1-like isoform X2 n=1 Tax=Pistacia vera TaxID=55513 RepID=UPI001262DD58|nr:cytochrome P450 83B1-like isoform X2 [Pistacia vera]
MALLIILVLSLPILLLLLQRHRKSKSVRSPPGPRGLPLIGNIHQFDISNTLRYLWNLSKQYGPLVFLRLGFVSVLVVSSAKMAKEVLKTHDLTFSGRPNLLGQQTLSYNFLDLAFSPYNAYWREMRKVCVIHLFNSIRVQLFRPVREDEVYRMIKKISKSADASQPINLSEVTMSLTSTIICRLGFGKRYEDEGGEKSRFSALHKETQVMLGSFFFADHFPFLGWVDKLTGMRRRLEKNFEECDKFYQELIEEHLDPKRPKNEQEDIIDVLLQIKRDREIKVDLTYEHIKAILMNVFVGGTDAIAASVVWAMTNLTKNPRTMKKAQEEIRNIIGKKGFVDEDDVEKLPYLKAVVKETLRLEPAAPLIPRETTEKCIVNGYEIQAKTLVFVNAWAVGRDPEAWDNPEEFNPDRFIGSCLEMQGQNFELIPFGSGRRICPGIHMGIVSVELALANLLYHFDWEMPAGMKNEDLDFDVLPGITMHKKNPLRLVPRKYM